MGNPGDQRLDWATGPERSDLAVLDAVVAASDSLACGLVSRGGGPLVLNVVRRADKSRSVDVGCERVGGVWWFVEVVTGEGVVPVAEVGGAPAVLVGLLARTGGHGSGAGVRR